MKRGVGLFTISTQGTFYTLGLRPRHQEKKETFACETEELRTVGEKTNPIENENDAFAVSEMVERSQRVYRTAEQRFDLRIGSVTSLFGSMRFDSILSLAEVRNGSMVLHRSSSARCSSLASCRWKGASLFADLGENSSDPIEEPKYEIDSPVEDESDEPKEDEVVIRPPPRIPNKYRFFC